MRRGNQGKAIHRLEDGTLLGVNLGADFTAEHEWGIKRLRELYRIDDAAEGIARRQIRHAPTDHLLFDAVTLKQTNWQTRKTTKSTWWGLISFTYPLEVSLREPRTLTEEVVNRCELSPHGDDEICGAWDEGSFGFVLKDEAAVREIHDALEKLDLCIGLFNGEARNPFSRSGLGLLIASRIPQSVRDLWLESDRDGRKLVEAAPTCACLRGSSCGRTRHASGPSSRPRRPTWSNRTAWSFKLACCISALYRNSKPL